MADHFDFTISGHRNIYTGNLREYSIYFSTPTRGISKDTGICLLIPGYGGHVHSNVYRKMRDQFSDEYNLVVIQCHYFGQEFMQTDILEETIENFNDMSFMQAIDNVMAVQLVMQILRNKDLPFNSGKVILFGQSHGAYLAYLCNTFAPKLFTLLIDNSSYLYPIYLTSNRQLQYTNGDIVQFNYIAADMSQELEICYLPSLYSKFSNNCRIVSYNGSNDNMVPSEDKRKFITSVNKSQFHLIHEGIVDNKVFSSTSHGLGADFLLLFRKVMRETSFETKSEVLTPNVDFETSTSIIKLDYSSGLIQFSSIAK